MRAYKTSYLGLAFVGWLAVSPVFASEFNLDLTAVSDYRYNGVSLSNKNPALQSEFTYSANSGIYAGFWLSTADYGEGEPVRAEVNGFLGYEWVLSDAFALDFIAETYHYVGKSGASNYDYLQAGMGFLWGDSTSLHFHYAPDYDGTDTSNIMVMFEHTWSFSDKLDITLALGHNQTGDKNLYDWRENSASYQSAELTFSTEGYGYTWFATFIGTTIKNGPYKSDAKPTVVLGVTKALHW